MKKTRFGKAFPDELKKAAFLFGHFHKKTNSSVDWTASIGSREFAKTAETELVSEWRKLILPVVILLTFGFFLIRLFHLQIVNGNDNRELADSNRIQIKLIHAPRGVIYDRNGKILAQNEPGFRLVESTGSGNPKVTYINRDQALNMEVNGDPRIKNLEIDSIRTYPFSEKMSHVLGYVGEITADELKDPQFLGYKIGDQIGRGGVEESYEKILKGTDGGEVIEVDASGRKLRSLRKTEAIPGQNLYLSVDSDLQNLAYDKLKEAVTKAKSCCGAVVAEDPASGEILALASYPSFDPKKLSDALNDENSPILNRVIGGAYPPGSTFKIASSLAGLSSGKITKSTQFEDTGVMSLGTFTFANWYFTEYGRKEEGGLDVVRALQRSNDIFFYQVGSLTGEKILGDSARKLDLGKKVGIDIPGEVEGLIPDNDWKVKNMNEVWYPGDTLHMAIGQGFVLSTPLQINNMASIVASSGKQFPPHLALKITSPANAEIKHFKFDPLDSKVFKTEDVNLVKKGLEEVPLNGGTAWPFFNFPIPTAGKTGTAEYGDAKKTHAWYTGYAPAQNPKIVATALVEGGGEGSTVASPIVKEIFRWYLSDDKKNLVKDLNPIATESARTLGE